MSPSLRDCSSAILMYLYKRLVVIVFFFFLHDAASAAQSKFKQTCGLLM